VILNAHQGQKHQGMHDQICNPTIETFVRGNAVTGFVEKVDPTGIAQEYAEVEANALHVLLCPKEVVGALETLLGVAAAHQVQSRHVRHPLDDASKLLRAMPTSDD
jgi:hypothetical protein